VPEVSPFIKRSIVTVILIIGAVRVRIGFLARREAARIRAANCERLITVTAYALAYRCQSFTAALNRMSVGTSEWQSPKFAWRSAENPERGPPSRHARVRPQKQRLIPFQGSDLSPPWRENSKRLKRASECIARNYPRSNNRALQLQPRSRLLKRKAGRFKFERHSMDVFDAFLAILHAEPPLVIEARVRWLSLVVAS